MKSTHQNPSGNNQTPTEWATYHLASNRVATNSFAPAIAPAPGSVQMDADGRLLYDGSKSYLWEAQGTLCGVTTAAGNHYQYFYDAEGRRVTTTSRPDANCAFGTTTLSDYILDQAGRQITELDGNGHWKHTNIYANGELLATYDPAGTHFALSDWLGDKRLQASAAGVAELSCWNFPFNDDFGCTGTDATEHRYTGKEHDPLTGIDLFGAREFTGYSGRFLSPDWSKEPDTVPYADLHNPQSLNLYSYVNNNPLSKADKDGHIDCGGANAAGVGCQLIAQWNTQHGVLAKAGAQQLQKTGTAINKFMSAGSDWLNNHPLVAIGLTLGADLPAWEQEQPAIEEEVDSMSSSIEKAIESTFPSNESQIGHIFREAEGHVADSAANRELLQSVANDPAARLGSDQYGTMWSARTLADGSQAWVQTRGTTIVNAGINATPKAFNPQTGLKAQ